jgi:hypothetical protein
VEFFNAFTMRLCCVVALCGRECLGASRLAALSTVLYEFFNPYTENDTRAN